MKINKEETLNRINQECKENTLMETLKIVYTDCGDDFLTAEMPVDERVHQVTGIMNGGATAALLECVGSRASSMLIDREKQMLRGIELSINHLSAIKYGKVIATAKIIKAGRTLHLWSVIIKDGGGKLVSSGKLTNIILDK